MKDDQTQARLARAIEELNENLAPKQATTPRAQPDPPPVDIDAVRRSVVLGENSPYRRTQARKQEYLAREDGRRRHQELRDR